MCLFSFLFFYLALNKQWTKRLAKATLGECCIQTSRVWNHLCLPYMVFHYSIIVETLLLTTARKTDNERFALLNELGKPSKSSWNTNAWTQKLRSSKESIFDLLWSCLPYNSEQRFQVGHKVTLQPDSTVMSNFITELRCTAAAVGWENVVFY